MLITLSSPLHGTEKSQRNGLLCIMYPALSLTTAFHSSGDALLASLGLGALLHNSPTPVSASSDGAVQTASSLMSHIRSHPVFQMLWGGGSEPHCGWPSAVLYTGMDAWPHTIIPISVHRTFDDMHQPVSLQPSSPSVSLVIPFVSFHQVLMNATNDLPVRKRYATALLLLLSRVCSRLLQCNMVHANIGSPQHWVVIFKKTHQSVAQTAPEWIDQLQLAPIFWDHAVDMRLFGEASPLISRSAAPVCVAPANEGSGEKACPRLCRELWASMYVATSTDDDISLPNPTIALSMAHDIGSCLAGFVQGLGWDAMLAADEEALMHLHRLSRLCGSGQQNLLHPSTAGMKHPAIILRECMSALGRHLLRIAADDDKTNAVSTALIRAAVSAADSAVAGAMEIQNGNA